MEVVGWVDAEMMLEVCRNIAYKRMPLPLAHVGGRRAYHIQITIVTQRLAKSLEPISRVSRTAGTRSLEVKKGEMIWMFAYTMDIHKVCFATTSMISDSNQVRI